MKIYEFRVLILGFAYIIAYVYGESSTCLTVYREGGAPAVFQSPKCPRWKLSTHTSRSKSRSRSPTMACQSAVHMGRRKYQEDRTFCSLDIRIPFPVLPYKGFQQSVNDVPVGLVAVFDGHNGFEASEMASKLLLEYFTLHTHFLLDTTFSILSKTQIRRLPNKNEPDHIYERLTWDEEIDTLEIGRFKLTLSAILDGSFHLDILKESLLRAIHDIDASFSKEASRKNFDSGSTATVVLIADGQILVANIGDSKAFLCSEIFQSPSEAKATLIRLYRQKIQEGSVSRIKDGGFKGKSSDGSSHLNVKELTRDHHPDRDDEKIRVESAGGHVLQWGGVSRINGQLAVSRAIGDLSFKSYGVISVPEVTDWQILTDNDSYLIAASDGVFEKLSPQDVCDLIWEIHTNYGNERSGKLSSSCLYSLAECIVNTAYEKGSMDNLAAVVIPFRSSNTGGKSCGGVKKHDCSPGKSKPSGLVELDNALPVIGKFDRLLVKGIESSFSCFYLSENLNENDDYTFWLQNDDKQDIYDSSPALPDYKNHQCSGLLNLYTDQNMCMHFGMSSNDGNKDQCINPEGFASFLGLLESIPVHNIGPDDESRGYTMPDSRYRLKKRFDRGSYGEVWLAFHWNCSHTDYASNWTMNNSNFTFSSSQPDETMFILKRIMVERGASVYLSGLREKHFGEIFLNASTNLGGLVSDSFVEESPTDLYDEIESTWSSVNESPEKRKLLRAVYEEGLNHIARYVESFESRSNEIWLVFRYEGVSLSKLLYTAEEVEDSNLKDEQLKQARVLRPSKWWNWLKTTEAGQAETRNLIWQLLMALKSCHDRNVTHRDIKPENMVICFEELDSGRCLKRSPTIDKNYTTRMRIIDFGSAVDEFTMKHLYGSTGPSRAEQTYEYTPPEAYLNASWYQGPTQTTLKYDMWSVGVVMLELIIGSPNVFQINAITRALLDQHLDGWNESLKELAYKLRSFMEMCILIPGSSSKYRRSWGTKDQGEASPASWKCSEEFFSDLIKSRDPLNIGFPDVWALRLVRQLLRWDPEDRPSVDEALRHPYFTRHQKTQDS